MRNLVLELDLCAEPCQKDVGIGQFQNILEFVEDDAKAAPPGMGGDHVHDIFELGDMLHAAHQVVLRFHGMTASVKAKRTSIGKSPKRT